jgi:hypothetical protein
VIKVSVEVREGAALFRVAVQAESIGRAMSIVNAGHPGRDVRVVFPIDLEEFFIGGSKTHRAGSDEKAVSYGHITVPQRESDELGRTSFNATKE